jgi:hypothetical protein
MAACNPAPRYQLVPRNDREVYRIDTQTGEVWLISGVQSFAVLNPEATLKSLKADAEYQRKVSAWDSLKLPEKVR